MSISLMNLTGAPSSTNNSPTKPLSLNEGQMVHGQIKKLFPGQMAEVQIGNQKLIAKLEVPMKAGDSYYFQVKSVQPELQLKIISGPTEAAAGKGHQLNKLVEAMQLPKTAEMKELLSFVIKNKIPMTREGMLQAETLLRTVPPKAMKDALTSIQKMAELKLPFTESVFRSILGVESKEGLHSILATLKSLLLSDSSVSPQTKLSIKATLDTLIKPFAEATGSALLGQSIVTLLDRSESADTRFTTIQLLKNASLLPNQASLANLPQLFASLLTEGSQTETGTMQKLRENLNQLMMLPSTAATPILEDLKGVISADKSIQPQSKEALLSIINRAVLAPPSSESITRFVQEFSQAFTKALALNTLDNPFKVVDEPKNQLLQTAQNVHTNLQQLTSALPASINVLLEGLKGIISSEQGLHQKSQEALLSIINRELQTTSSAEKSNRFAQEFSQAFSKAVAEGSVGNAFKMELGAREQLLALLGQNGQPQVTDKLSTLTRNVEGSENPALQKLLQAAEASVATAVDGKAIKDAMQTIIRSLGLNYESVLLRSGPDLGRLAETLKPQLIALMQDQSVSAVVRESAELVVMRMNGPLLLSGENGVQHQLIMQVPLDFFGKKIDATMQWNGRMKDDGKIDPAFARVLFYLDLHSLEKTIVDMQVQNRIVTVTVFNANPSLELLGAPMQEKLKEGLESTGYKLSGIFFGKYEEDEETVNQQRMQKATGDEGVDFLI